MSVQAGHLLTDFADFVVATGDTQIRGPMDVLNAASKRTNLMAKMIGQSERHKRKMIPGGTAVRWNVFFRTGNTYGSYRLGQNRNWRNVQPLKTARAYFSFNEVHSSWNEAELILNEAITYGDEKRRFQEFVRLRDEKQAIAMTDQYDGMDRQMGAVPVAADMSGADPAAPTSFFALLNEETNGLYTGFTDIHGIAPADANGNWAPQRQTYASISPTASNGLFTAFAMMRRKLKFYVPPTAAQYYESDTDQYKMIVCSNVGQSTYEHMLQAGQDAFVSAGRQDPGFNMPTYKGIPLFYWDEMDTAAIYSDGSGGRRTELVTGDSGFGGPRYAWADFNTLYPFFHDEMFMHKREVKSGYDTPDTFVAPIATYWNLMCEDRRKQGWVYPSADITTIAA